MLSKIVLALALAGAKAQLPGNKDSKKFEYDAGDKGKKGCDHVDLLPSKRCNYARDQDRWGYDKGVKQWMSPAEAARKRAAPTSHARDQDRWGYDKGVKQWMSPAEACPEACGTYKPWKGCKWIRSNSNVVGEKKIGKAKDPDDCIKMVKKECPDATIANYNIEDMVAADGGNAKAKCWCQYGGKPKKQKDALWASCYLGEPDTKKKRRGRATSTPRRASRKNRHFPDARRDRTLSELPRRASRKNSVCTSSTRAAESVHRRCKKDDKKRPTASGLCRGRPGFSILARRWKDSEDGLRCKDIKKLVQFGGKPKKDTGNYASCYLGEPDTKKKCKKDDKKWKDSEDGLRCKDIKKSDDRKKMCKKLRGETADGEIVKAYEACCKTCKKYA
eukprot:CAMPEP_0119295824 /NCGR_PEP_ID=MMETSP1329-20130426/50257_1 /TAXON_ID=114041 /ORGANISM="Genus nov. species nov., Strain RCC1024" /LENGTH=388 /DNA_ID=CAMNT_0007296745 /DNA_START=141 /DNA_END=1309 /DNA_ORIENTATION=-